MDLQQKTQLKIENEPKNIHNQICCYLEKGSKLSNLLFGDCCPTRIRQVVGSKRFLAIAVIAKCRSLFMQPNKKNTPASKQPNHSIAKLLNCQTTTLPKNKIAKLVSHQKRWQTKEQTVSRFLASRINKPCLASTKRKRVSHFFSFLGK